MRMRKKYNISVIPFPITLGDKTYTSRVDFDNEQFFSLMEQYDEIPKTSQITPFQFQEIYLREARSGVTDLVLVLINSKVEDYLVTFLYMLRKS